MVRKRQPSLAAIPPSPAPRAGAKSRFGLRWPERPKPS